MSTPARPDAADLPPLPADPVQRRTLVVLSAAQVLGGVGVATGVAVSSLVASELSGSDAVAGLAQTSAVVGAALAAVPLSRLAASRGRRRSLTLGYAVATVGAVVAAAATLARSWPLLLVAMLAFGAATASGLASRFAATDLAAPSRRATALSVVIWATTVGSVLGPTLAGVADRWGLRAGGAGTGAADDGTHAAHEAAQAAVAGAGPSAGPYVLAALAFGLAALVVAVALRPDPLVVAAQRAAQAAQADQAGTATSDVPAARPVTGLAAGWGVVRASATARLALVAVVVSHLTMVGLMSMTPVHMNHGGATLQVVGLVISAHIAGMYVLSPVVGWLADRWGHARVLLLGGVVLLGAAVVVAGAPSDDAGRLTVGLVLLGVGWSCGLVAGSALLVDATPAAARTAVQGVSDLAMNLGGALGGVLAGVVITVSSYAALAWGAAGLVTAYLVLSVVVRPRTPREVAAG